VAELIEFYVPDNFRKSTRWIPPQQRGKVLEFRAAASKTPAKPAQRWHGLLVSGGISLAAKHENHLG
jgi:hypothetical protein